MKKFVVTAMVGSLRKDSHNLKLAKAIGKLGKDHFDLHLADIASLPLYNQDLDNAFPAPALALKESIQKADALLFVTPEYNRGIPGPLKNAIDWASRPYGKNAFAKKPAGLCGASVGAIGTACAQQSLKSILNYLDVALMGQPEVYLHFKENLIDHEGHITDPNVEKFLQGFVDQFVQWVHTHHHA